MKVLKPLLLAALFALPTLANAVPMRLDYSGELFGIAILSDSGIDGFLPADGAVFGSFEADSEDLEACAPVCFDAPISSSFLGIPLEGFFDFFLEDYEDFDVAIFGGEGFGLLDAAYTEGDDGLDFFFHGVLIGTGDDGPLGDDFLGLGAIGGGHLSDDGAFALAKVFGINDVRITRVPEPGTLALVGIGLLTLGFARRRSRG